MNINANNDSISSNSGQTKEIDNNKYIAIGFYAFYFRNSVVKCEQFECKWAHKYTLKLAHFFFYYINIKWFKMSNVKPKRFYMT